MSRIIKMPNLFPKNNLAGNGGYVLLTAVVFFLLAGSAIVFGVSNSVVREIKIANDLFGAKEAYYLSEAGNEDVAYRVKNGTDVSATETLTINGNSVITDLTDVAGGKLITSESDFANKVRRIESKLVAGIGVAFNYGVQVGTGGFRLEENGVVVGNVYASGDISGGNNAQITGSAVSASSPALAADQINDTPSTPGNSIVFRKLTAERDFAQSFILSAGGAINKVDLYIKKNSNPGSPTVKIMTDNGGVPGVELAHGTLNSSLVTTNYGWVSTTLDSNPELNAATTYWLVVYTNTYDSSKYYTIGANNSYTGGQAKIGKLSTGAWNNTSPSGLDGYFKIYLGGLTGSISNLVVGTGTGGEAWAHTVTGSTVEGVIYCQTGSGNNKNCNTSRPDPAPQVFPISDGNIAEWKAQAEAGGTINGNYTLSQSTTLGPKKIIGNLTIQNSKTLTVAGTLWVTGNILIDDQSKMDLSSSYGTNSGVVVADGTITTTNNSSFSGSGSAGSYLMLLSESYNDYAIKLDNNVEGGILYARNGVIELENNAKAKELSAYKIHVGNNGRIDYESGLINPTFSSGPSGGYSFDSWREVE